ncbi:uncharacterized protein LOC141715042 [Apium graveolens]|uniref:uncharacterized protein LOC141715042 n=1 Tax=Apium graveolens TaxID=4045 RepID=UPI003D7BCEDA
MSNSRISFQDMLNPLFLHPSDGATSIQVDKLQGSSDYRSWKRYLEIGLTSKCKLGFVKGTVERSTNDTSKAEMWDTCDNMVISWLTSNVSSTIRKSIIYMTTSREIWLNLEQHFSVSNGSRKYKLSKELYDIKQNDLSVNDYYTAMRTVWEELDSLNALPTVVAITPEIKKLMSEIELQKEEFKLFQFLNGLNEIYSAQRSQLLLNNPLPNVENATTILQQEEAQREILTSPKAPDHDILAMYSKGIPSTPKIYQCTACGGKGHTQDRCWSHIGYPGWHPKYKGPNPITQNKSSYTTTQGNRARWSGNQRQPQHFKSANVAQSAASSSADTTLFTPEQLA